MADKIMINGQVYSTTEDRGLPGIDIYAYDDNRYIADTFLGSARSGRDGQFSLMVDAEDKEDWLRQLNNRLRNRRKTFPDIFFEVYGAGQLLGVSETVMDVRDSSMWVDIQVEYPPDDAREDPITQRDLKEALAAISDIADLTPTSRDASGRYGRSRTESDLQAIVENAFTDVLGRNLNVGNAKTFTASLERAFPGEQKGDHTKYMWNPRTYAVLSELGGGLSGAQASIYHQARAVWEDVELLLNNLTTIDPKADVEQMEAVRAILHTEMVELVNELGYEGGPRVQRANYIFNTLLNPSPLGRPGLLQQLKDAFSIDRSDVITVEDEEQYTHLIMIEQRIKALEQSWRAIESEFIGAKQGKYLGTQLVLISRSLAVVADAVEETMNVMDSVLLGPSERKTLKLDLGTQGQILLGDLLEWVQTFASDEGPTLAVEGGIRGVETIYGIADQLQQLVEAVSKAKSDHNGFKKLRVRRSLEELARHLDDVRQRAEETLLPAGTP